MVKTILNDAVAFNAWGILAGMIMLWLVFNTKGLPPIDTSHAPSTTCYKGIEGGDCARTSPVPDQKRKG